MTWILATAAILGASWADAAERSRRHLDETDGLLDAQTEWICQDSTGFVWVGSFAGLSRFDGASFVQWAPNTFTGGAQPVCGPGGEVLAIEHATGQLFVIDPRDHLAPHAVTDAQDRPVTDVDWAAVSGDGTVWFTRDGDLVAHNPQGVSRSWGSGESLPGAARKVFSGRDDSVLVGVGHRVVRVAWDTDPAAIAQLDTQVYRIAEARDGVVWVGTIGLRVEGRWEVDPGLFRVAAGDVQHIDGIGELVRGLATRDDRAIAATASQLLIVAPDGALDPVRTVTDGADGWADVAVDHEGGLWSATFRGVDHFPEPDVITWNANDGLPIHPRFLAPTAGGVVVSTWNGAGRVVADAGTAQVSDLEVATTYPVCTDAQGTVWMVGTHASAPQGAILAMGPTSGVRSIHPVDASHFTDCTVARDGSVWIEAGNRLYRTAPGGNPPEDMGAIPEAVHGSMGHIAVADGIIHRASAAVYCRGPAPWRCEPVDAAPRVRDLLVLPKAGSILATVGSGALRRNPDGTWTSSLDTVGGCGVLHGLSESPRGGLWASGPGCVARMVWNGSSFELLERITTAHGAPLRGATSVHEGDDGILWLASLAGVTRIPVEVRDRPTQPRLEVLDFTIRGIAVDVDAQRALRLSYGDATAQLRVAALSFRAPSELVFRMRMRPADPWSVGVGSTMQFTNLRPGAYEVQVGASIDGMHWGHLDAPHFVVLPPWHRHPWFIAATVVGLVLTISAIAQVRAAQRRRLMEQRNSIARDLHDDLGSGLGSIGLTAELLQGDAADRIQETAKELGYALTDLMATLGPGAEDVRSLSSYLADRGQRMFPEGSASFRTEFPDPPRGRLSLPVRAHVQRIALEALHNAAKHADARSVVLRLVVDGREATLWVTDDGSGFSMATSVDGGDPMSGHGLTNMQRRATLIGGRLEVRSVPGQGTTVQLHFRLAGIA